MQGVERCPACDAPPPRGVRQRLAGDRWHTQTRSLQEGSGEEPFTEVRGSHRHSSAPWAKTAECWHLKGEGAD